MDIARAVWEDAFGAHPDDELRAWKLRQQRVIIMQRCDAMDTHAVRSLKIDEQKPDMWVDQDVAQTAEHPIAIVVGKGQSALVEHAHEAGHPAFVRAVRPSFLICGCEKEHGAVVDEGAITFGKRSVGCHLLQPIRNAAAVKAILEIAGLAALLST